MKPLALAALLVLSGCFSSVPVHVTGAVPEDIEEQLWDAGTIWDLDVFEAGPRAPVRIKYIEGFRRDTISEKYPRGTCGHANWRLADCSREITIDPKCGVRVLAHELGHTFGIHHGQEGTIMAPVPSSTWDTTGTERETAQRAAAFLATCPM